MTLGKYSFNYDIWQKCPIAANRKLFCLNITKERKVKYIIAGNIDIHYTDEQTWDVRLSWKEASDICVKLGGILPQFFSRDELDEFIALLFSSLKMPIIEGIFLGLTYNKIQVCQSCCF